MTALLIMAKAPQIGQVKTRLCPPLTLAQACQCHEAFLLDTLGLVRNAKLGGMVAYSGSSTWFSSHCPDFERFEQQGEGLAERLIHGFQKIFSLQQHRPVLCIGSDSPHLPLDTLKTATKLLENCDVVFGPALDGGYYLVGMHQFHDLFTGMPMSTDRLFQETLERCQRLQLRVGLLPSLRDLDTWADVVAQQPFAEGSYTDTQIKRMRHRS